MPVMDGFSATRAIREFEAQQHRPITPIVAMTAFTMPEDQQRCLDAGMTDYISKPFTQEQLSTVVLRHLHHIHL